MAQALGQLEEPPIAEVVCGAFFKPVPGLDPVSLGAFWKTRQKDFPRRELKTPIAPASPEGVELSFGPDVGPLRTWLISKDDVFIIQIQHDRFYLNWRARQHEDPRFNDRDSNRGLLSRFLEQAHAFEEFCVAEFGTRLELQGAELSKIDQLVQGRHWAAHEDLAALVPMLEGVLRLSENDAAVGLRSVSPRTDGSVEVSIDTAVRVMQPHQKLLKLEFRRITRRPLETGELETVFKASNAELNELFSPRVIPEKERRRFSKGWKP